MTDVTIVVATYDRPAMLEVELHSILASEATVRARGYAARIIVVDDCSPTHAARHVVDRVGAGVEYLRLPDNRGVAGALLAGFERVESRYYALWGDDDFMLPRWFALHLAAIEKGHDVVSGSYWLADAELLPTRPVVLPPATLADLMANRVTANDGSLVRRSALDGISWKPERGRAMVMSMWLALASAGKAFTSIDEPSWLYRRHAGNISRGRDATFQAQRQAAIAEHR